MSQLKQIRKQPPAGGCSGCRKSLRTFPTACKNAVTFPPLRGGKVLAALAERLAKQGIQGIRSHSRRAAAPSSSPANTRADSSEQRFFDKLNSRLRAAVFLRPGPEAFQKTLKNVRFSGKKSTFSPRFSISCRKIKKWPQVSSCFFHISPVYCDLSNGKTPTASHGGVIDHGRQ